MSASDSALLQETLELARALIRIPSFNPPGNEADIATFVADWLKAHGVHTEFVSLEEGRDSLVARIPGKESGSLVICGHLDTVTANASEWDTQPLAPVVREDRLWGLGAADMKASVAVLMQTMAQCANRDLALPHDLVLVLTADEEWGYRGAASVASSGLIDDAEVIVIAEPTQNLVHRGQKGELWIEASFTGVEAHGSMPESGTSAVLPAARFCLRVQESIDAWLADYMYGRATLNIGRFNGGRQVNVVPGHCSLQLDARVVSQTHHDHMIKTVDRIGREEAEKSGCKFSYRVLSYHPPVATASLSKWGSRLAKACHLLGGEGIIYGMTPYSTDAVSFSPIIDAPILICGPGSIAQAHQPNEFIDVEQISQALEIMKVLIA